MTEQADNLILGGKKLQLPYFSLNAALTAWGIFYTKYLSSSWN